MPHSPLKVPGRAPAVPGFNSKVATVGAIRIHYWIGGEPGGSPILLWHGFLGTGYMWRHVMTALAEAGFAVLVPAGLPGGICHDDKSALNPIGQDISAHGSGFRSKCCRYCAVKLPLKQGAGYTCGVGVVLRSDFDPLQRVRRPCGVPAGRLFHSTACISDRNCRGTGRFAR